MNFNIRLAQREDCSAMLELIRELAIYEKAPDEVTVDPLHFEESGFGLNPVWWAFVVENQEKKVVALERSGYVLGRYSGNRDHARKRDWQNAHRKIDSRSQRKRV